MYGCKPIILFNLLTGCVAITPCLVSVTTQPAELSLSSRRVTTLAEFTAALQLQSAGHVNVEIVGLGFSTGGKPLPYVPAPNSYLHIVGVPTNGVLPKISFGITWDNTRANVNGWFLRNRFTEISNVEIADYDNLGKVIKQSADGTLIFHNCRFTNIGNGPFIILDPPCGPYVRRHTGGAGGFNLEFFGAYNCTGASIGTNAGSFSHWFSFSAKHHSIINCTLMGGGPPFALYDAGRRPGFVANSMWWTRPCKYFNGYIDPSWIVNGWTDIVGVKIAGNVGQLYTDDYGLLGTLIDDNNYSGAKIVVGSPIRAGKTGNLDWAGWQKTGRDLHSKPPATRPGM